jgi:repressor LexA
MNLTPRQFEYYRAIKHFMSEQGVPPGLKEIGQMLGVHSLATVHKALLRLEEREVIKRKYDVNGAALYRSIELLELR